MHRAASPPRPVPHGAGLFVYTVRMSWASRRQFLIISGIVVLALSLVALFAVAVMYKEPSCTDGIQNADEVGVDCGGSCAYMCLTQVERPVVRFARVFSPQEGRYDVIAYIDNRNPSFAAKNTRLTVELFDEARQQLSEKEVTIDLPAGSTVPVYIPEAYRGAGVVQVFVTIDEPSLKFYTPADRHRVPSVTSIFTENSEAPRIRAQVENTTAYALYDIRPVATVFDTAGNAIAASQTYLPQLGAYGKADVLFTWNRPFSAPPARVEVLPVVPLIGP